MLEVLKVGLIMSLEKTDGGCVLDNTKRSLTSGWEGRGGRERKRTEGNGRERKGTEGNGRAGQAKAFYVPCWKGY